MSFVPKEGKHFVNKNVSVIEVNGNSYDAVTGQLIGAVQRVANQVRIRTIEPTIDGIIRKTSESKELPRPTNHLIRAASLPSTSFKERVKHSAQNIHQKTQYSRTLMRSAVNRPMFNKQTDQTTEAAEPRISQAKVIVQQTKIQRFVRLPSRAKIKNASASAVTGEVLPSQAANLQARTSKRSLPAIVNSISHHQLERLLDHALAKADVHKQALRDKRLAHWSWQRLILGSRWLTLASSALVVILLGGVFAWNHVPYLSMEVASLKSNFHASVPNYTPSGFSFNGPIRNANGSVTLDFKAKADSLRVFSIKQEPSNWDSRSLAVNAVPANAQVQTSQVKGSTVYIYSDGNKTSATWVNNGTRTTIEDRANLNADQILKIAEGL